METERMILAILQARTGSTRLPNKVLAPILGRPMLARQIERLQRAKTIDRLIVATTQEAPDAAIERLCKELSVACYRGSLDDVLDRFYQAAKSYDPNVVVRLTGDCPLVDPELIDRVVETHRAAKNDYTSNTAPPTYPDGLDVEVMTWQALQTAWKEARLPSEREHVTPFIRNRPGRFRLANVQAEEDCSKLRWTVDEPADLVLVQKIYEALYPSNPQFGFRDVLTFLQKHPELQGLNAGIPRNAGYQASLERDHV